MPVAIMRTMGADWIVSWEAAEAQCVRAGAVTVDLPSIAVDAMVAGWDSRSLRLLAGMTPHDDARDVRETFLAAVDELGRQLPGANDAALRLVRFYSAQIIRGTVGSVLGARLIARLGYDLTGEAGEQVMTFVALEDEASGGWGRPTREVEEAIVHAAREALTHS